ncbi:MULTISPECIES: hypothetical protein [unclassified Streptomyces]
MQAEKVCAFVLTAIEPSTWPSPAISAPAAKGARQTAPYEIGRFTASAAR